MYIFKKNYINTTTHIHPLHLTFIPTYSQLHRTHAVNIKSLSIPMQITNLVQFNYFPPISLSLLILTISLLLPIHPSQSICLPSQIRIHPHPFPPAYRTHCYHALRFQQIFSHHSSLYLSPNTGKHL